MGKYLSSIILVIPIFLFGCGTSEDPKSVAQTYVNDLTSGKLQQAASLTTNPTDGSFSSISSSPQIKEVQDLFKHAKITLGKEKINGSNATVEATVTSVDISKILTKMIQTELGSSLSSDKQLSQSEQIQEFDNALNSPSIGDKTTNTEIKLVHTDSGWKISSNNSDFENSLTSGLMQMFNSNQSQENENTVTDSERSNTNSSSLQSSTEKSSTDSNMQSKVAYMGQKVNVGSFVLEVPDTIDAPVVRTSNNNVFAFGNPEQYFFIGLDVTNNSEKPQEISSDMFRFTWTPKNGSTEYYIGDVNEEYNIDTATYKNGAYYYALPYTHTISPHTTEVLDLIYDIPSDMSPNESGIMGLSANVGGGMTQEFQLTQLN
ncbi:hypothetical protein [Alicyclobacillus suci]|uniref:hypothetical protein n=1 Tax=Alicyclobacillus suci TaxID=2816080 RepID=UPI001A8F4CA6|nr:hypothetical protein [Alicyclobacillus suci]